MRPLNLSVVIVNWKNQHPIIMTEHKWLNFAGHLNQCMCNQHHKDCPFKKYQILDQYERLEFLMTVDEHMAEKMMMKCCHFEEHALFVG